MRYRRNIKRMTPDEKRRYVEAVVKLKDPAISPSVLHPGTQSRYDDYAEVHLHSMHSMTEPSWAHRGPAFYPWHRELLYQFEKDLQAIDPEVTVPYWDWAKSHSASDAGWPFTHDFLGGDGDPADSMRVKRDPAHAADPVYPHPFDPEAWTIIIKDSSGDDDRLQRHFGTRGDAPNLPDFDPVTTAAERNFMSALETTVYDVAPWTGNTGLTSFRLRSEALHNRVHRWVGGILGTDPNDQNDPGGTMYKMTSPNDPIFFLHHAAIDRMWEVWRRRNPAAQHYLPAAGADPGHNLNDNLIFFHPPSVPPWPGTIRPADLIDSHAIHGTGVWYDTDIPEITLETPSVGFGNVPEGLTMYRAARFHVKTGQRTYFRVTTAPTGNFGLPDGTLFHVDPQWGPNEHVYGYVWFSYLSVAGPVAPVVVRIQPFIRDEEAEYTGTVNAEVNVGPELEVTLTATSIARVDNAIALVLDRSGSMAAAAGGTATRETLLRNAVSTFASLMRTTDRLGIVNFDHENATLTSPALVLMDAAGQTAIQNIATGPDLEPRGSTGIGGGIVRGRDVLDTAPAGVQRAMLVFTDGHQNEPPNVETLPPGEIDSRTYAIGFGRTTDVNTDVLQNITQRENGDLIVTGEIATDEQQFLLSKYFVQVLAGIEKLDIVLDPDGALVPGVEATIPFILSDADVEADVIVLCPIPQAITVDLVTPGGEIISPAATEPNVTFTRGRRVAFHRMLLPAMPSKPDGSHAGEWKAKLRIDEKSLREAIAKQDRDLLAELARSGRTLPYSLLVHARSNLNFDVKGGQRGYEPGDAMQLHATLREYGVPFRGQARVWCEVARPDDTTDTIALTPSGEGRYDASYPMTLHGTYRFRVFAEGATSRGSRFRREKTVTGGIGLLQTPPSGSGTSGVRDVICRLLGCILSSKVLTDKFEKRLADLGINLDALRRCIGGYCGEKRREPVLTRKAVAVAKKLDVELLLSAKSVQRGKRIEKPAADPRPERPIGPEEAARVRAKIFDFTAEKDEK